MNQVKYIILIASTIRIALVFYSSWHDRHFDVKYTDIDYNVFSSASQLIKDKLSPYEEKTYRYTPLIAYLLLPNFVFGSLWGKFLFCFCDIICALLMSKISDNRNFNAWTCISSIWLFNPVILTVSSRGNAESILGLVILLTMYHVCKNNVIASGFLFGLCIHMKLYPIIYVFSIYLYLCRDHRFPHFLVPNISHWKFGLSCITSLGSLTYVFYRMYGWKFIDSAYMYHLHRVDIKHNFSVYFYSQYLLSGSRLGQWLSLLAFVPQFLVIFAISWRHRNNLLLSCLLSTVAFVAFNKVITSQYFMWHLFLLPIVLCRASYMKLKGVVGVYSLWFLCQGLWLFCAYKLEFEGQLMFLQVWLASVGLFVIHILQIKVIGDLFISDDKIKKL